MSAEEDDNFARECVQAHNIFRAKHGVPPLQLSTKLTDSANEWAQNIADKNKVKHSPYYQYGENVYVTRGSHPTGDAPVKAWYFEIKDYNFSKGKFSKRSGHFTQLIWKDTKELGVGIARKHNYSFVVATYYPPGNIQDQFKENVPRIPLIRASTISTLSTRTGRVRFTLLAGSGISAK